MVQISLMPEEAAMMQKILETYLSDLRMEVANTDRMDYREQLKEEERFIKRILSELPA